jgi:hypothetical protein
MGNNLGLFVGVIFGALIALLLVVAAGGMMGGTDSMMGGWMAGGGLLGMLFGLIFWVGGLVLIGVLVVWISRRIQRQ